MIPYGRQEILPEDIDAVVEVLRSDFLTQGPMVPAFEKSLCEYSGARHAVAVNSATSALHIACLALGLGPGDQLWTSPITFVASANCALYCGATVDFVDIDPATCNLCPRALEEKLLVAEAAGCLPKIVVPVHFAGQPCDMKAISALSQRFGFFVIEDASHAIGARYLGEPVGNCHYSDITIFSFHPVKIITTGEGGAALTNRQELADRMALLRSHGITRDEKQMDQQPDGPWYYQQVALGFNYRMTDIQAALGVSQMKRLDACVTRRHEIFRRYGEPLSRLPLQLPWLSPDSYAALHLYVVCLQDAKSRQGVFAGLRQRGIGVNVHYIPVHTQPWYRSMGFRAGDFPQAERYYESAISLPIYPQLKTEQQDFVVNALQELLV
jgi:UDP-4-amino-4,6-dideoxy-N-acetyl-beta-L-altrosamine transaminase